MQFGIELLQAVNVDIRQPFRCNLPRLNPARKLRNRGKRNVGVICRQGSAGIGAANVEVFASSGFPRQNSRQHRVPLRCRRKFRFERQFARSSSAFVERRHLHAPVLGSLCKVGGLHLDLHELFRLGEGGRCDLGANRRRRSKSRRCARWQLIGLRPGNLRAIQRQRRTQHSKCTTSNEISPRLCHLPLHPNSNIPATAV